MSKPHLSLEALERENAALRQRLTQLEDHRRLAGGDASPLAHGVLNTLPQHVAVVREDGVIVITNAAWDQFARDNGDPTLHVTGPGSNYFAVCRRAAAAQEPGAQAVLDGLLAVLHGQLPSFELEYACHSPHQLRWYMLHVLPLPETPVRHLLVTHTDVTACKLTENTLRASEERYRRIFATISDFAYVVEVKPDGTYRPEWLTPVISRVIGRDPIDLLSPGAWRALTHPDDWPIVQNQIDELLANRSATVEYRLINAAGDTRWVIDHAQPQWDDTQQRVTRFYGAVQDITTRKQAEGDLERLAHAARQLSATFDLPTIYNLVHDVVKHTLPCDFFFVSTYTAADQLIRCVYGHGSYAQLDVTAFPPIPLEAQGHGTQSRVIRSGESLLLNDYVAYLQTAHTSYYVTETGELQSIDPQIEEADTPHSALIVPLKLEGQVVGVIQALSQQRVAYTPRHLQFLESLAAHLSTALANAHLMARLQAELADRQQAEAALRASEYKFRSFIEQAAVGLSLTTEDGHIIEWNQALTQISGIPRADAIGHLAWEVQAHAVPPQWRDQYPPAVLHDLWMKAVKHDSAAKTTETPLYHPDLGLRTIEDTVFPILTERGRMIGQMVRDVTEQRRLEAHYRLLFNEMQDGFALCESICDDTGNPIDIRILEVNPAFERLTDLRADRVMGRTLRELVPAFRLDWLQAFGQVALTRRPAKLEGPPTPSGRYFNVTAFSPQRGQIAAIFQDVSERRQADRQLRLHSAALQAAANGVIITDRRGNIQWANRAFGKLSGYAPDETLGRNPRELVRSGRQSREFYQTMWHTILNGQVWRGELINRRHDGALYVEEMTITPVRAEDDDTISHFIAVKQDVTTRQQVDQALRQYAERLRTLHEIDRGIAVAQSPQDTALSALRHLQHLLPGERASVTLLDQARGEAVVLAAYAQQADEARPGQRFPVPPAAIHPLLNRQLINVTDTAADLDPASEPISRNLLANGIRSYLTAPLLANDELLGLLNVGASEPHAFEADHVEIVRELAVQLGIALQQAQLREQIQQYAAQLEERVQARTRDLAAANARLQELDNLKSKFVSEVSHELRTPVTSLGLYLDLLKHGKADKRAHYLDSAQQQAARMRQLIEDILDLSRLERDKPDLAIAAIDLNAILEQAAMAQQPRAEANGLTLLTELLPGLPLVQGDINRLMQVVTNLLTNAINYTPAGEVHIRSFQRDDHSGFQVSDTGQGIAPEDLPHLFERFYRGQRASQSNVRGTGLGLSIVKDIIDWHGGQVEVQSEVGVGSTFTVWLPVAAHP